MKKKKPDLRIKRTHSVQLDINKDVENWLHEWIEHLTKQRKFSQYVRDGLRLMIDLSAGNVDVLVELFPWIRERLTGQGSTPPESSSDIQSLENKVEQLTQIILSQNIGQVMQPSRVEQQTGKEIAAPKFDMPVFDDDDDDLPTLKLSTSSKNEAAGNFLRGLSGLHH